MKLKPPSFTRDQAITNWLHCFEQDEDIIRLEALVGNDEALPEELAKALCNIAIHVAERGYKTATGKEMDINPALNAIFLRQADNYIRKSLVQTGYYLQANLHKPVALADTFDGVIWYQHCLDSRKKRCENSLQLPPALEAQVAGTFRGAVEAAMTAASRFFAGFYCDIATQVVLANAIGALLDSATLSALEGTPK